METSKVDLTAELPYRVPLDFINRVASGFIFLFGAGVVFMLAYTKVSLSFSWLFPVYLIGWGLVCQAVKPPFVGLWFFITVGLPFYGVGLWAHRARRHIPYLRFVFLTMVTPFLIFVGIALLLAFGQLILKGSKS